MDGSMLKMVDFSCFQEKLKREMEKNMNENKEGIENNMYENKEEI